MDQKQNMADPMISGSFGDENELRIERELDDESSMYDIFQNDVDSHSASCHNTEKDVSCLLDKHFDTEADIIPTPTLTLNFDEQDIFCNFRITSPLPIEQTNKPRSNSDQLPENQTREETPELQVNREYVNTRDSDDEIFQIEIDTNDISTTPEEVAILQDYFDAFVEDSTPDVIYSPTYLTSAENNDFIIHKVDFTALYQIDENQDGQTVQSDGHCDEASPKETSEEERFMEVDNHVQTEHEDLLSTVEVEINNDDETSDENSDKELESSDRSLERRTLTNLDYPTFEDHVRTDCASDRGKHNTNVITSIREEKNATQRELSEILEVIEGTYLPKIHHLIFSNKHNNKQFESNINILIKKCLERTEELKRMLDEVKRKAFLELRARQRQQYTKFVQVNDELQHVLTKLSELIESNKSLSQSMSVAEIKETMQYIKTTLGEVDSKLEDLPYSPATTFMDFKDSEETVREMSEIFGHVIEKRSPVEVTKPPENKLECITSFKHSKKPIWSVTSNADGSAWVGAHEEMHLSLVTKRGIVLRTVSLGAKVYDTTLKQDGSLLISAVHDSCIRELFPNRELANFIEFKDLLPCGLHAGNSGSIYVGLIDGGPFDVHENSKRSVVRLSSVGSVVQKIAVDSKGKRIFTLPYRIHENSNLDICVIDWLDPASARLVLIDRNGEVKDIYSGYKTNRVNVQSFRPGGVVCTKSGMIIVCDIGNDVIHLLDSDAKCTMVLNSQRLGGLYGPCDLSLDKDGVLWVGECNGDLQCLRMIDNYYE